MKLAKYFMEFCQEQFHLLNLKELKLCVINLLNEVALDYKKEKVIIYQISLQFI